MSCSGESWQASGLEGGCSGPLADSGKCLHCCKLVDALVDGAVVLFASGSSISRSRVGWVVVSGW